MVAEQLLMGGIAAVRKEIDAQNARNAEEGRPPVTAEPLLALAEDLVPRMRAAEWRDRAEGAVSHIDEVDLRDLRSVIVAADEVARDDEARQLVDQLKAGLASRVEREQNDWLNELAGALGEGRTVRALHLSSRPPKAGSPLPRDLMQRLLAATQEAFTGEVSQHRLGVLVEAVAYSPVRMSVTIDHVPEQPNEELLEIVRKIASRAPELAARFGVTPARAGGRRRPAVPPPPVPPPPTAEDRHSRAGSRRAGRGRRRLSRPHRSRTPPPHPSRPHRRTARTARTGRGRRRRPSPPTARTGRGRRRRPSPEPPAPVEDAAADPSRPHRSRTSPPTRAARTGRGRRRRSRPHRSRTPPPSQPPAPVEDAAAEPAPVEDAG